MYNVGLFFILPFPSLSRFSKSGVFGAPQVNSNHEHYWLPLFGFEARGLAHVKIMVNSFFSPNSRL